MTPPHQKAGSKVPTPLGAAYTFQKALAKKSWGPLITHLILSLGLLDRYIFVQNYVALTHIFLPFAFYNNVLCGPSALCSIPLYVSEHTTILDGCKNPSIISSL